MKNHKHDSYDGLIRDLEAEKIIDELFGDELDDLTDPIDTDRPDDRTTGRL
tara:strand:+ start:250 stop:402 length:153 start_codon:yes stop_codon:yes gene_type:complete